MAKYGPRKPSRVELNANALTQTQQILAKGVLHFLHDIALEASSRAADAPPYGEGLVKSWGAAMYVNGKKVGDISGDGKATAKPREFRPGPGLTGIVGFGFPARFVETGTSDTRAQPFFTPSVMAALPNASAVIGEVTRPLLGKP